MLSRFGFGGANYAERATEYAVDAVSEAFIRAANDSPTRFDIDRGVQTKPVDDRFWTYLLLNCLRPLITRDAEKWASRSRWPQVPLDEALGEEAEASDPCEDEARAIVDELIGASEGDLRRLLLAARAQFEEDSVRTSVNWKALQKTLGISRYACDLLRRDLDRLRLRTIEGGTAATFASRKR